MIGDRPVFVVLSLLAVRQQGADDVDWVLAACAVELGRCCRVPVVVFLFDHVLCY